MILPNKHLKNEQSILWIGGEILRLLSEPKTISRLWVELRQARIESFGREAVTYRWYILALDFLYLAGAIALSNGKLEKKK